MQAKPAPGALRFASPASGPGKPSLEVVGRHTSQLMFQAGVQPQRMPPSGAKKCEVLGLGYAVKGLGFRVWGLGIRL